MNNKQVYFDSFYKINYFQGYSNLTQYPFKSIQYRGLQGVFPEASLYFCVPKEISKTDENLATIKPKSINSDSALTTTQKRSKSDTCNGGKVSKRRKTKLKIVSSV